MLTSASLLIARGQSIISKLPKSVIHKRPPYLTNRTGFQTSALMNRGFLSDKDDGGRFNRLRPLPESRIHPTNRFLTVPNLLTSSRIVLTPAIGYFVWNEMNLAALSCFTVAAVTDLLDGYLARRLKHCSRFGAILDPVADKLLMTTTFVALYKVSLIPSWLFFGMIGRDLALLGGGAILRYLSFHGARPSLSQLLDFDRYRMPQFKPTLVSKCNTALQCLLIFIHLGSCPSIGLPITDETIMKLDLITACTTAMSFGQYLSKNLFTNKPTKFSLSDSNK